MMTSLPSGQLAAPLIEDLHYTTFVPDTTLLTTLTYMDGKTVHVFVSFTFLFPHSVIPVLLKAMRIRSEDRAIHQV